MSDQYSFFQYSVEMVNMRGEKAIFQAPKTYICSIRPLDVNIKLIPICNP